MERSLAPNAAGSRTDRTKLYPADSMLEIAIVAKQLGFPAIRRNRDFEAYPIAALGTLGKTIEEDPGEMCQAMLIVVDPECLGLGNGIIWSQCRS